MKSAKEMFEVLGYEKDNYFKNTIKYSKTHIDKARYINYKIEIFFDYTEKQVIFYSYDHGEECNECMIDMPTFKAIQKQLEELRWLE